MRIWRNKISAAIGLWGPKRFFLLSVFTGAPLPWVLPGPGTNTSCPRQHPTLPSVVLGTSPRTYSSPGEHCRRKPHVPVLSTQQQMRYSMYRAAGARTRTREVKEEKRAYAKLRGRGAIFPRWVNLPSAGLGLVQQPVHHAARCPS